MRKKIIEDKETIEFEDTLELCEYIISEVLRRLSEDYQINIDTKTGEGGIKKKVK